jgi:hypothetical protein
VAIYLIEPPDEKKKIVVSLDGEYACVESSPGKCFKLPKEVAKGILHAAWHRGYRVKKVD